MPPRSNDALVKQERQRGGRKRKRMGTAALVAVGLAIAAHCFVSIASLHRRVAAGLGGNDVAFLPSRPSQSEKGGYDERDDMHDDDSFERGEEEESTHSDGDDRDRDRVDLGVPAARGVHTCQCLPSPPAEPIISSSSRSSTAKGLRWLHIPKTGTSFFSTLWSYACTTRGVIDLHVLSFHPGCGPCYDFALMNRYPPEMYCRRDTFAEQQTQHKPVNATEIAAMTVVSFFRQPESRLISAYDDGIHTNCFTPAQRKMLMRECGKPVDPACFARFPGVAGCSTRMLTGKCCAERAGGSDQLSRYTLKRKRKEILTQNESVPNLPHKRKQINKEEKMTREQWKAVDGLENNALSEEEKEARGKTVTRALKAVSDLGFVGLTEEFNESICQFHKLFGGEPQQSQFHNIHSGKKKHGVEDLAGFKDRNDRVVYAAAKTKWERMVGEERCYRYLTSDGRAEEETNTATRRLASSSSHCVPKSCAELGNKQCGEWPDGCGGVTACGLCNAERTGLPDTWRVQCVEGKCIPTCTPWVDAGIWFYSEKGGTSAASNPPPSESAHTKDWSTHLRNHGVPKDLTLKDGLPLEVFSGTLGHLSPKDAVLLCAEACRSDDSPQHRSFATQFCACGIFPTTFLNKSVTFQDYSDAHDLLPVHGDQKTFSKGKAFSAELDLHDSQPKCCPARDMSRDSLASNTSARLQRSHAFLVRMKKQNRYVRDNKIPKGWKKGSIQADFFEHIDLGCGAHNECERHGHHRNATVVVINIKMHICHLGRDAGDEVDATSLQRHYLRLTDGTSSSSKRIQKNAKQ